MTPLAPEPEERSRPALERELGRMLPGLSRVELARLAAHIEPVAVPAGQTVFRQGNAGRDLYLVLEGALEAEVSSEDGATMMTVGRFEAGDAYTGLVLAGPALSLPYWRLPGLL